MLREKNQDAAVILRCLFSLKACLQYPTFAAVYSMDILGEDINRKRTDGNPSMTGFNEKIMIIIMCLEEQILGMSLHFVN